MSAVDCTHDASTTCPRCDPHRIRHALKDVTTEPPLRFLVTRHSSVEIVVRAAVLKDGKVYDVPRPGRHDKAIHRCCEELQIDTIGDHEQGFLTTWGRFVGRHEAALLAFLSGQVERLAQPRLYERTPLPPQVYKGTTLPDAAGLPVGLSNPTIFSEDLW